MGKDLESQARAKIKEAISYLDISPIKKDRLEDILLLLFIGNAPIYLGLTKTKIKDKNMGWIEVYLPPIQEREADK